MYITHKDIEKFAEDVVNLPSEHAKNYRNKVKGFLEHLEKHIKENPDYHLKGMMLSGSLAKHTSLKSFSDADVALYVKSDDAPQDMIEFLSWLADDLATIYPHIGRRNIEPKTYSISIALGNLDVDVVPIYWINNEWDGELVSQADGSCLRTNIPKHIEFMKKRHKLHESGFKQVIRLLKFWAARQKQDNEDFRFKSFMIELIVAHLADNNRISLNDYPEALRQFFDYLIVSDLNELIFFNDFIPSGVNKQNSPINIFDPVNHENNIAGQYTKNNKILILEAAMEAADAIEYAACATTKEVGLRQWRKVFGNSFKA